MTSEGLPRHIKNIYRVSAISFEANGKVEFFTFTYEFIVANLIHSNTLQFRLDRIACVLQNLLPFEQKYRVTLNEVMCFICLRLVFLCTYESSKNL